MKIKTAIDRHWNPEDRRAMVLFGADARLPWLRILKKGYRHCFVIMDAGLGWVMLNPLMHQTQVDALEKVELEALVPFYEDLGFRVVVTHIRKAPLKSRPWRPFTCVELVKRVLGVDAPWALTPWQLFKVLSKYENEASSPIE